MKTATTLIASLCLLFGVSAKAEESGLIAVLHPTGDNSAEGFVTFTRSGEEVTIHARVSGLEPNSKHGFHIHQFGDTSAADGTSAGGHFNPEGHDHALPETETRHAGDLGNLTADESGLAELTLTSSNIDLAEGDHSILGRAVVVHAKPDDGGQPTGNAGPRIAVGTIGLRNPETEMKPVTTKSDDPSSSGSAATPEQSDSADPTAQADTTASDESDTTLAEADSTTPETKAEEATSSESPDSSALAKQRAREAARTAERIGRSAAAGTEEVVEEIGEALSDAARAVKKAID